MSESFVPTSAITTAIALEGTGPPERWPAWGSHGGRLGAARRAGSAHGTKPGDARGASGGQAQTRSVLPRVCARRAPAVDPPSERFTGRTQSQTDEVAEAQLAPPPAWPPPHGGDDMADLRGPAGQGCCRTRPTRGAGLGSGPANLSSAGDPRTAGTTRDHRIHSGAASQRAGPEVSGDDAPQGQPARLPAAQPESSQHPPLSALSPPLAA